LNRFDRFGERSFLLRVGIGVTSNIVLVIRDNLLLFCGFGSGSLVLELKR